MSNIRLYSTRPCHAEDAQESGGQHPHLEPTFQLNAYDDVSYSLTPTTPYPLLPPPFLILLHIST